MVLQCPRLRIIDDSDRRNVLLRQRAGADLLAEPPHVGAAAQRHAAEGAGQHRPAGHDDRRQVDRAPPPSAAPGSSCRSRRAARRRRSGWRAASPRSPSRPCCATASRSAGPASRRATPPAGSAGRRRPPRRPACTLSATSLRCALHGRQVGGGVGDRDVRPAVERVRRQPAAHPGPVDVGVAVGSRRTTGCCAAPSRPPLSSADPQQQPGPEPALPGR